MKKELEQKIYNDFPELYREKDLDMSQTAMCWGFEFSDGWFNIIYDLSKKITEYCKKTGYTLPAVQQAKEKFGTLRYYLSSETDDIFNMIREAEDKSEKTCEICGKRGKLRQNLKWIKTLCRKHYKEFKGEENE